MFQKQQTGLRALRAAGIAFALMGFASQSAMAQEAPAVSNDSLTVVRDAETGTLRAPTPAEAATLKAQSVRAMARIAPKPTLQKFHSSGARGARLTDEFMTTSVAVRNADGSISITHGDTQNADSTGHVHTITPVTE
ncbi:hypothetical protein HD842_001972 [Massilia aurea]|jgi:hypothetical protein|uniref:Uncharacterized protein n=1 Tax=Massilia aurea TaxID=373040 RepID=A0A7W9WZR6_9BURK|nr:hypothetical protein [Massilia aurea]MBB6133830.1 hypothetical protein [Massilia aurea]